MCREGYPDATAWDPEHPFFDPKTKAGDPRWFMVDVQFQQHLTHFVPLALLQHIVSDALAPEQRSEIDYLTDAHLEAVTHMPLLQRSRLSVQVRRETYTAC